MKFPKLTSVFHTHVEGKASSFQLPSLDLLDPSPPAQKEEEDIDARCRTLEDALRSFGVESRVLQVNQGPIISSFEIEPARGVKVSQITSLADDIALVLKASRVRVVAPIPGKSAVGVEIPNLNPRFVYLREVLESDQFGKASSKLAIGLGRDILGRPLVANLGEMPHLLVAGTTGSGKTVCLSSIIVGILFQATPHIVPEDSAVRPRRSTSGRQAPPPPAQWFPNRRRERQPTREQVASPVQRRP